MSATILESLSNRKFIGILIILLIFLVTSFYIGSHLTPPPSSFEEFTSVHCYRKDRNQLAIPRHHRQHDVEVKKNCNQSEKVLSLSTHTFAVQLPLPRDGIDLAYSRWMQTLLVILIPDFQYEPLLANDLMKDQQLNLASHSPVRISNLFHLLIDVDLAVKNRGDEEWTIYAQRKGLKRSTLCSCTDLKLSHKLDCDMIELFELQSLHYDYYLINFEIRDAGSFSNKSTQFPGSLREITGVAIHHNGGFTQIWLSLKTFYFVVTLSTLYWYCNRLRSLNRKTTLIERLLMGLGIALTQFDAPVELLSLQFEITFMTFLNDLRQGIFYCTLLSFWIIFFGEHLWDGSRKNSKLTNYWKELLGILFASLSLLIFDLSHRGIQALDPFLTIWDSHFAKDSITVIAGFVSLIYMISLVYRIVLATSTILGKHSSLPQMQMTKRLKYQGLINRFYFILLATILCAVSTVVFYILSQRHDWSYDDDSFGNNSSIEWTSAMLITVCAMWNVYVLLLMALYAPSHKGMIAGMTDQIEFDCLTDDREEEFEVGEMKLLQELANKANLD